MGSGVGRPCQSQFSPVGDVDSSFFIPHQSQVIHGLRHLCSRLDLMLTRLALVAVQIGKAGRYYQHSQSHLFCVGFGGIQPTKIITCAFKHGCCFVKRNDYLIIQVFVAFRSHTLNCKCHFSFGCRGSVSHRVIRGAQRLIATFTESNCSKCTFPPSVWQIAQRSILKLLSFECSNHKSHDLCLCPAQQGSDLYVIVPVELLLSDWHFLSCVKVCFFVSPPFCHHHWPCLLWIYANARRGLKAKTRWVHQARIIALS